MLRPPFKGALPSDSRSTKPIEPLKVSESGVEEAVLAMAETPIRDDRRFVAAARHAAQCAVNPARLIDGENMDSPKPADAKRWVRVYSELVAFKQRTLEHMYHDLQDVSWPANQEIRQIDVPLIEGEQLRYQKRLQYWQSLARQQVRPAPFESPFHLDAEGNPSGQQHRTLPARLEFEQEAPAVPMNRQRRQYD